MQNEPFVSVIMPVYNCEKYVCKAIDSIINQNYTNWELLIGDDCSIDATAEILNIYSTKDNRIKVFRNTTNLGSLETRMLLFNKGRGELLALQDADDSSEPVRLHKQVEQFEDASVMLCGTWARYFIGERYIRSKKGTVNSEDIYNQMFTGNQFCSASVMFRKELLKHLIGYRLFFKEISSYDYDFYFRIVERFKAVNIGEFLYNVELTDSSNSRKIKNNIMLFSAEIVRFLANQRKENQGKDSLSGLNPQILNEFIDLKEKEFVEERSLLFRREADLNHFNHLYRSAFRSSLNALWLEPTKLINWKYLLASTFRMIL